MKDIEARATLLVVAPVKTGPSNAVPGALQFTSGNKKKNIKIFLNINYLSYYTILEFLFNLRKNYLHVKIVL